MAGIFRSLSRLNENGDGQLERFCFADDASWHDHGILDSVNRFLLSFSGLKYLHLSYHTEFGPCDLAPKDVVTWLVRHGRTLQTLTLSIEKDELYEPQTYESIVDMCPNLTHLGIPILPQPMDDLYDDDFGPRDPEILVSLLSLHCFSRPMLILLRTFWCVSVNYVL